jgi:uncharacterized protein affecting Mg2+/Co2+ transport
MSPKHAFSVEVQPEYLAGQSDPAQDDYQFAYTVTVTNQGTVAAQLISRHWVISDALGHTQEVKGLGVVGRQPLLQPGESFQYTSGCRSHRYGPHQRSPGCEGAALNAPLTTATAELEQLLARLDPGAGLAERHLWLLDLTGWVRGDQASVPAALDRVQAFIDAVDARPELQSRLQAWWQVLVETVDITTLLADFGFAPRNAMVSEMAARLRHKLLPGSPETLDASELFSLALPTAFDAQWLAAVPEPQLNRLVRLLAGPDNQGSAVEDRAAGRHHLLRRADPLHRLCPRPAPAHERAGARVAALPRADPRRGEPARGGAARPAHARAAGRGGAAPARAARSLPRRSRHGVPAFRRQRHLGGPGVSPAPVARAHPARARCCSTACSRPSPGPERPPSCWRSWCKVGQERRSLRALLASNSSLLAAKVAERSAETGEHYITRTPAEYRSMVGKAAGGGAVMAFTTLVKFGCTRWRCRPSGAAFWAGVNYAVSFVLVQLLHFTVATKQPAMTAPAMAAKLKELASGDAIESFVDEVTHLVRSQVAAVLGNVLVVYPVVLAGAAHAPHPGHTAHL